MKPYWKIARIKGVDVHLHAAFPLLLLWVASSQYRLRNDWADVGSGLIFTLGLFLAVVLHEFGHLFAARRYGIRTRDIILLPIGGITRRDRPPANPGSELMVALAGPALTVMIALILFFGAGIHGAPIPRDLATLTGSGFLSGFAWANVWLAGFNLLPAFPLDGGRGLRALLAIRIDPAKATRIAVQIGHAFAIAIVLTGLLFNPLLVIVAFVVWFAAATEADTTEFQSEMNDLRVAEVMLCDCHTLVPNQTLASAAQQLLTAAQEDYPVLDRERHFLGILHSSDLAGGLADLGPQGFVSDVMQRQGTTSDPGETVDHLLQRWPAGESTVAVIQEHIFLGLLTAANLSESVMVHKVLRHHTGSTPNASAGA